MSTIPGVVVHGVIIPQSPLPDGTHVEILVQSAGTQWKEDADQKIDEALAEIERGEVAAWKSGDAARLGREYLQEKRAREAKS